MSTPRSTKSIITTLGSRERNQQWQLFLEQVASFSPNKTTPFKLATLLTLFNVASAQQNDDWSSSNYASSSGPDIGVGILLGVVGGTILIIGLCACVGACLKKQANEAREQQQRLAAQRWQQQQPRAPQYHHAPAPVVVAPAVVVQGQVVVNVDPQTHATPTHENQDAPLPKKSQLQPQPLTNAERINYLEKQLKAYEINYTIPIKYEFICPVTDEIMTRPVELADTHSYEESTAETLKQNHSKCPLNNTLYVTGYSLNLNLKNIIDDFVIEQENHVKELIAKKQASLVKEAPASLQKDTPLESIRSKNASQLKRDWLRQEHPQEPAVKHEAAVIKRSNSM